ncbi:hypothetical protein L7F22_057791 [Adiantum nelumboides]|nr:hypothetical protein [Adiantum nelumboides]
MAGGYGKRPGNSMWACIWCKAVSIAWAVLADRSDSAEYTGSIFVLHLCVHEVILIALGQDEQISIEAGKYAKFFIPTLIAFASSQNLIRFLQTQNLVYPMLACSGLAAAIHVPLCWVLVYKTSLGFTGAALSTSICNWINVILLYGYITLSPLCSLTRVPLSLQSLKYTGSFVKLALPSAAMLWHALAGDGVPTKRQRGADRWGYRWELEALRGATANSWPRSLAFDAAAAAKWDRELLAIQSMRDWSDADVARALGTTEHGGDEAWRAGVREKEAHLGMASKGYETDGVTACMSHGNYGLGKVDRGKGVAWKRVLSDDFAFEKKQ